jgi:hypothetical protein
MTKNSSLTKTLLEKIVLHKKWKPVDGLLMHPFYNEKQKVRLKSPDASWVPVLDDPLTAAYLLSIYLSEGGAVSFDGSLYVTPHMSGAHLGEVMVESLCSLWGLL